jgi:hypothetical protein
LGRVQEAGTRAALAQALSVLDIIDSIGANTEDVAMKNSGLARVENLSVFGRMKLLQLHSYIREKSFE